MTKRAVVVGVNNYSILDPTGDTNLNYCVNDAVSMYHLLRDSFGFTEIYFYADLNASRTNILRALRHIIRISETGDSICFYFSGHGARIRADLDRADCDLYYECLIPASGSYITDRDILDLTDGLYPDAINFTVITDACHSGGMHHADATIKCKTPEYSSDLLSAIVQFLHSLIPCGICLPEGSTELNGNVSNVTNSGGMIDLDPDPNRTLIASTKSTLISACRFDELSWETGAAAHGLFTKSILETVNQSNFEMDYNDFTQNLVTKVEAKIAATIRPTRPSVTQRPQLFGQRNRMTENILAGWTFSPAHP